MPLLISSAFSSSNFTYFVENFCAILLYWKMCIRDRVAVMGVDNSKYCDICYPKLTSLNNRLVEMSLEAARILLDSLEGRENPDRIMLFSRIVALSLIHI